MNYIEQKKKLIISGFITFTVLFFIFYRVQYLMPGIAEHCGSCILYPFLKMHRYCIEPIKIRLSEKNTIKSLQEELYALHSVNDALRAEITELKAVQAFTQDIQEIVAFKKRYNTSPMHTAQILVRHQSLQEQFIYVDAGALSGITINMIALYKNMVVGRVTEVYPWYSKIQLITDPSCNIAVYDSQTGAHGIYRGTGSSVSQLSRVNHLDTVNRGDELFSSGDGLLFPRGYFVGTIDSYETQGLYHMIQVLPAINIDSIRYCTLIERSCGQSI